MRPFVVKPHSAFNKEIFVLGDKSIAHRAVIISSLAKGKTIIKNFPTNKDCLSTLAAFKKLGVKIKKAKGIRGRRSSSTVTIHGAGLKGFKKPRHPIFIDESGTTYRLLLGVLAGQDFEVRLIAGKSLARRPMLRVIEPLRRMGVEIQGIHKKVYRRPDEYPPITIKGRVLKSITYKMPVASAQVKSAILLAGLFTKGKTRIIEPVPTRDHTERMLKLFKAGLRIKSKTRVIEGGRNLISPKKIYVPGDISSAAFFIVLASLASNSKIVVKNVGLNPTRIGVLKVLKRMGASIRLRAPSSELRQASL